MADEDDALADEVALGAGVEFSALASWPMPRPSPAASAAAEMEATCLLFM